MSKSNPNISTSEELNALDASDKLNLKDAGMRLAFAAENFDR